MSTEAAATSLPLRRTKPVNIHPLAPITANEIRDAVRLIRAQWPAKTDLHFKAITLQEPAKNEAVPFIEAEFNGGTLPHIDRKVFITYYLRQTVSIGTFEDVQQVN
jgi:primary-amine oxidase